MKIISILLMLFGVLLIVVLGLMYLLGFAMSFDAPDSGDGKAWLFRLLMFVPILILVAVLIFAMKAFASDNYVRSMRIGLVFVLAAAGIAAYLFGTSYSSLRQYRKEMAQDAEDARLYPRQKFIRPYEGGADTIIVFPNRIVAYRFNSAPDFPLSGPLGDLNEKRDAIIYNHSPHNDIRIDELDQFVDAQGRKLTDVYAIR